MGTVNTTLPRYPSIINQYSNNSFFILDNVDGRGDYVINRDRDHDINKTVSMKYWALRFV